MDYEICEADGQLNAETIRELSAKVPSWPVLEHRHFKYGYWWLALSDETDIPVAFACLTPMEPFPNVGYFKRSFVEPAHRGHGLQYRLIMNIELKARQLKWSHIVAECDNDNEASINNLRRAGFDQ